MVAKSRSRSLARLAILASMLVALPAQAQEYLDVWKKSGVQLLIKGPVRLNLAYTDKSGKEQVAQVDQLTPPQLDGLPHFLADARNSPLLRTGYFASLWNAMKDQVCKDVQASIHRLVDHSPNTAYDIQPCFMSPSSYVVATFQTQWDESDSFTHHNGPRMMINLSVPFNGVQFWVTSPHTCHHGGSCNPGQAEDPTFGMVFTANLFVMCTPSPSPDVKAFNLPLACQGKSSIDIYGLYGGDVTGNLKQAAASFAGTTLTQAGGAIASGGASLPEAAAVIVVSGLNVLMNGIGAGIALIDDQHLRDSVSAWLSKGVGSPTLQANATNTSNAFNRLFTNMYDTWLGGFRPFAVAIGTKQLSLDFGLVYPKPAAPVLRNTIAAQNAGSIIAPSIAVLQPDVLAGQLLPVKASSFRGTYATAIPLAWTRTVLGAPHTEIAYGPPPTQVQTTATTFDVTGLKPLTSYQFSVRECDGLSCSPSSNQLAVKTEAGGANEVVFWLDKDVKNPVGKFPAPPSGGDFTANVRIPANTAPGAHTLYASIYGRPPASAPITVCQAGGCKATIGVVNTANGTLFPPGGVVMVGGNVTLRGGAFAPNGEVGIYLDNLKTSRITLAPVGPVGGFQATFRLPMVPPGHHQLIAIEARPGSSPPQFVEAAVPVYVQAAVQ